MPKIRVNTMISEPYITIYNRQDITTIYVMKYFQEKKTIKYVESYNAWLRTHLSRLLFSCQLEIF